MQILKKYKFSYTSMKRALWVFSVILWGYNVWECVGSSYEISEQNLDKPFSILNYVRELPARDGQEGGIVYKCLRPSADAPYGMFVKVGEDQMSPWHIDGTVYMVALLCGSEEPLSLLNLQEKSKKEDSKHASLYESCTEVAYARVQGTKIQMIDGMHLQGGLSAEDAYSVWGELFTK